MTAVIRRVAGSTAAIAIAAIIAILAVGVLVFPESTDTYRVTSYFPRAIGLFERSTVRLSWRLKACAKSAAAKNVLNEWRISLSTSPRLAR